MSTLNDQIKVAAPFAAVRPEGPVVVDQSKAAAFGMDWAARQTPKVEEPTVQMKPITPVAN